LKELRLEIHVLETQRLRLRSYVLEDFAAYATMWADPEVARHIGDGSPKSEAESWTSLLRTAGHWQMLGYGSWAIDEKAGGRFIGGIGFNNSKRDRGEALRDLLEIGWMLAPPASGKGYATEALQAALEWGGTHFGPVRVIAITAPENFASMRVAQKCGFKEFLRGPSLGRPRVFFDRIL
jgi:RimJ/RimL family protein N-acetyltransferase